MEDGIEELKGQVCPMCKNKELTLTQIERDVPFFGKVTLFSMTCSSCKYHMSDVESCENKGPVKVSMEITCEDDLKIRVIKSSQATIKVPNLATITPGPASIGFISNVEGIINRIKRQIEAARDNDDDPDVRKKAKNQLKKIMRILWGQDKQKLIIEDPSGNSAIISDKAVISKI